MRKLLLFLFLSSFFNLPVITKSEPKFKKIDTTFADSEDNKNKQLNEINKSRKIIWNNVIEEDHNSTPIPTWEPIGNDYEYKSINQNSYGSAIDDYEHNEKKLFNSQIELVSIDLGLSIPILSWVGSINLTC